MEPYCSGGVWPGGGEGLGWRGTALREARSPDTPKPVGQGSRTSQGWSRAGGAEWPCGVTGTASWVGSEPGPGSGVWAHAPACSWFAELPGSPLRVHHQSPTQTSEGWNQGSLRPL